MRAKRKYLKAWDLVILTIILLGQGIYISNVSFFLDKTPVEEAVTFTSADNIRGILLQGTLLAIALAYLWLRKFDFSQWKFKISLKATLAGVGVFLLSSFVLDLVFLGVYGSPFLTAYLGQGGGLAAMLAHVTPDLILYSMLNGCYEELFFLGMCMAVKPEHRKCVFVFALLLRISFHTYQGIPSALGIGIVLSVIYTWLYVKKSDNLYSYFLGHAIADVFGATVIGLLGRFI